MPEEEVGDGAVAGEGESAQSKKKKKRKKKKHTAGPEDTETTCQNGEGAEEEAATPCM